MFVLVRMEVSNHVDTQLVQRFKRYKGCAIYIRGNIGPPYSTAANQ